MYSVYAGEAAITGRNDARFRRAADKCRIDVKQIEGGSRMAYHTSCMGYQRFSQVVLFLLAGIAGLFPVSVIAQGSTVPAVTSATGSSSAAQGLPAAEAALINQRSQETQEIARDVSPHTNASSIAQFQEQINAAVAEATGGRIWDPMALREPSPRTSWGDPDLGGYWLAVSYVPLERPDGLADKPFYTTEEAIEAFASGVFSDAAVDPATVHYDWKEWGMGSWQSPMIPNLRTSMIVDPPDGKRPAFTAEGQARFETQARITTVESRSLFERCITGNQGPPRIPSIRNYGESQIVQTPDHVVLLTQVNSEIRIIPLDDRPYAPDNVRTWLGASRGYWEDETLVVETTNFHEDVWWTRNRGVGPNVHVTERYTRIDDGLLLYEVTLEDPETWEVPWSYEMVWPKMDPPGLFEFACHEMNYGLINVMRGVKARAAENAAE
jgi:hypothetical protein